MCSMLPSLIAAEKWVSWTKRTRPHPLRILIGTPDYGHRSKAGCSEIKPTYGMEPTRILEPPRVAGADVVVKFVKLKSLAPGSAYSRHSGTAWRKYMTRRVGGVLSWGVG